MSTFTRPSGTRDGCENVRCDDHSTFAADGFAEQSPTDPDGVRCWTPVAGAACERCGVAS